MSIFPLPVFEADADPANRDAMTPEEQLAATEAPTTMVVRFGRMQLIGEYESRDIRAGCGSKLVVRSHRGIELATMLTTTCPNAGCGSAVSRKDIRAYIEASGGKDYPFYDHGRVLRVATSDDLRDFTERTGDAHRMSVKCRELAKFFNLDIKIIDAELTLDSERAVIYYHCETRIDFRELVKDLAAEFRCRVDMRQVGARDEARLVADYERCGQQCCCKNFLKVLAPVSMRSAKQQKATLDPLKISGRCGRLMCCLRYEDQTYKELKANLPHRKTRVGTTEGPGIVVDGQILTQLVRIKLEHDDRLIAVPIEELLDPDDCPDPTKAPEPEPFPEPIRSDPKERSARSRRRRGGSSSRSRSGDDQKQPPTQEGEPSRPKRKKRRRRRGGDGPKPEGSGPQSTNTPSEGSPTGAAKKKRRRRRRKRGGSGDQPADGAPSPD